MTTDLDSFMASLPSRQEQIKRQQIEQRRKDLVSQLDPDVFPPDPRALNSMSQCMYVIRCIERGLSRGQVEDLFFGEESTVNMIVDMIGVNDLLKQDKDGNWKRTDKVKRLIGSK
jgi:hypothetical protein